MTWQVSHCGAGQSIDTRSRFAWYWLPMAPSASSNPRTSSLVIAHPGRLILDRPITRFVFAQILSGILAARLLCPVTGATELFPSRQQLITRQHPTILGYESMNKRPSCQCRPGTALIAKDLVDIFDAEHANEITAIG